MIERLLPNWQIGGSALWPATQATLEMVFISGSIAFILGIILGVLLIITNKNGLLENTVLYNILDKTINVIRSIPFLILIILLIPLSRAIVGTGMGVTGAIIPLVIGTTPFFARQVESAIAQINPGLIEASQALGFNNLEIIFKVYLRESIPHLTRVTQITLINLVALTTMAGAIGAGGLGDFAIRFGQHLGHTDLLWATIVIIITIVSIIQLTGNIIIAKTTK